MIATLKKPVYRGCFTLVYAYGLRIGETITLPVTAVDSKGLLLRVIGKGNKERALPLTESILDMLREVWKTHRSKRWLFPSQRIVTPLSYASARNAFIKARSECGFDHRFRPHSLRHALARARRGHSHHPDSAGTFKYSIHRNLYPSERTVA